MGLYSFIKGVFCMSYNPISLNVIRNSLSLSGVPQPMHIKTLDQVKFPTDTVVTAYRCIFAANRVVHYMSYYDNDEGEVLFSSFVKYLSSCFCSDIFPTDWDYNEYDDTLSVTICTRLVRQVGGGE
jgi:hypothetical protein